VVAAERGEPLELAVGLDAPSGDVLAGDDVTVHWIGTRRNTIGGMEGTALTHLDAAGRARMVDVSGKAATERYARARAVVRMSAAAARRVAAGDNPKGDVAAVARIAAIQAAKRTDELIPLCHSLPLTHVDPSVAIDPDSGTVTLVVEARTTDRTGVEMEALVACSVGALTVYDMVKGIEPGVVIERVELLDKTGGKADFHRS
jgi:cyclic pyranopterin phosphate synthase